MKKLGAEAFAFVNVARSASASRSVQRPGCKRTSSTSSARRRRHKPAHKLSSHGAVFAPCALFGG